MGFFDKLKKEFNAGVDSAYKGNIDDAQRRAKNALSRGKDNLGWGKADKAIKEFNTALKDDPYLADAYAYRGAAHRKKGALDLAAADLNKALSLDPNNDFAKSELQNIG